MGIVKSDIKHVRRLEIIFLIRVPCSFKKKKKNASSRLQLSSLPFNNSISHCSFLMKNPMETPDLLLPPNHLLVPIHFYSNLPLNLFKICLTTWNSIIRKKRWEISISPLLPPPTLNPIMKPPSTALGNNLLRISITKVKKKRRLTNKKKKKIYFRH